MNMLVGSQRPPAHTTLKYIDGYERPHYPLPAIRTQVFIEPGLVILLQSTDPDAMALVYWSH